MVKTPPFMRPPRPLVSAITPFVVVWYEAVYHVVRPVPLAADYTQRGRGWD
jgi:hypothetical protein